MLHKFLPSPKAQIEAAYARMMNHMKETNPGFYELFIRNNPQEEHKKADIIPFKKKK